MLFLASVLHYQAILLPIFYTKQFTVQTRDRATLYEIKKEKKKKKRKENIMQGRKVELYRLSARSEELFSDVAEKLCMMKDLKV